MKWLIDTFQRRTGIDCQLLRSGMQTERCNTNGSAAFQTIQKTLLNIECHAEATEVEVVLLRGETEFELTMARASTPFAKASQDAVAW